MKHHPRCGARTRSGRPCRRYVAVDPWTKKLRKRCRNHGGLSTGPKFPDGKERSLAAANAGLARWRERMRAAKAAGFIAKFPCGRKPGLSRRQREREAHEREEALARRRVEIMDAREPPRWPTRRGGSSLVVGLERLEKHFIARLSDRTPPSRELIEEIYDRILLYEDVSGRAVGKEERLACLSWAYNTWRHRQALKEVLAQVARQREARAAQTSGRASDNSAAPLALDPPRSTDSTAQGGASDDDAQPAAGGWPPGDVRHSIAAIEAIKARHCRNVLRREAERVRERERGVPRTLAGMDPRYRLP